MFDKRRSQVISAAMKIIKTLKNDISVYVSGSVGRKIYSLSTILITLAVLIVLSYFWISNTLTMVTNASMMAHTFSISLLEGQHDVTALHTGEKKVNTKLMYKRLNTAYNYALHVNQTPVLVKEKDFDDAVKIIDKIFAELDRDGAEVFCRRVQLLFWIPHVEKLVKVAGGAATSLEKYIKLTKKFVKEKNPYRKKRLYKKIVVTGDKIIQYPIDFSAALAELSDLVVTIVKIGSWFMLFAMIILGVLVSRTITRTITVPLKKLTDSMEDVGDLTVRINIESNDEIGEVSKKFNEFIVKMQDVIKRVKSSTEEVAQISTELTSTASNLSSGATEQTANVETMASSLEEISSMIEQNAQNSRSTDELAQKTSEMAKLGSKAIEDTVKAMEGITKKIQVIEEIAARTNLLALNASIEAARAGTSGKGFSVVANEVQKLAVSSQNAASHINEIVETSYNIAERAGTMFVEILPNIQNTADFLQDITNASVEQSKGVDQISVGTNELTQVSQQNASISEELSASAEMLHNNLEGLSTIMDFFKVN